MDVELVKKAVSKEDIPELDAETDYLSPEDEGCGICMDIIIDRGVLDCCQHMFCFECIDNWSTITNLCPLCLSEFQLITCVPVYDVFSSAHPIEQPFSRDDDWCIEGKNRTLSFPSYYIDENAVTCLDGDGCIVREGLLASHGDLNLDTSIACDSCDVWFHAVCVGFDPEGTSVDSWLCPRCLDAGAARRSDLKFEGIQSKSHVENPDPQCLFDAFDGKVSISIADAGETAVVVSLIDGDEAAKEPTEMSSWVPDSFDELKHAHSTKADDTFASSRVASDIKIITDLSNLEGKKLPLPTSDNMSLPYIFPLSTNAKVEGLSRLSGSDDSEVLASVQVSYVTDEVNASEPSSSAQELSINSTVSDSDKMDVQLAGDEQRAKELRADKNTHADGEMVASSTTSDKRKRVDCSNHEIGEYQMKNLKARREGNEKDIHGTPANGGAKVLSSDDLDKPCCQSRSSKDEHLGTKPGKKSLADIMSIVHGRERRGSCESIREKLSDNSLKGRSEAAGLRMKKIMRRPTEDKESSILVQKLRKEIRDAVGNRSSEDVGKHIFDPKLLAAFRAVVKVPASGPVRSTPGSIFHTKKSIFQKGNTRENLTRRIYGTSAGKRRHLWVRDFDVEFWKRRCIKTAKPEKIDTLKSVLDLLRKSPEATNSQPEDKSPVLSRLYLADASVFPRKDDIKPLSDIKASAATGQNEVQASKERAAENTIQCDADRALGKIKTSAGSSLSSINNHNSSVVKVASSRAQLTDKSIDSHKDAIDRSNDTLDDRRKRAQEFLARRNALNNKTLIHKQLDDNSELKQKFPLLGQLPTDMRPQVAPSRLTKIPTTVRQTQLYHLTEHFLKTANLSSIRRTAATEFSVADAINIEKGFAEISKTKVVYLNLCSQEIRLRSVNNAAIDNPSSSSVNPIEGELSIPGDSNDPDVESALRDAGLLSDSPPSTSPREVNHFDSPPSTSPREVNHFDDAHPLVQHHEEEPHNILEIDLHPELDIYGDFEYNLEDEDYIGAASVNISKPPAEGDAKMKLVFSTLNMVKPSSPENVKTCEGMKMNGEEISLHAHWNDSHDGDSATDRLESLPPGTFIEEGAVEPNLAEFEELYGPNSEPIPSVNDSHKEVQVMKPSELSFEKEAGNKGGTHVHHVSRNRNNSPSLSQTGENAHEEEHSGTNADQEARNSESVIKKVEAYIKEHIRPLCKSGVITVQEYRWAVGKATEKVMRYHSKAKNANFLIKEGEKVKKLVEQYVEAAKQK